MTEKEQKSKQTTKRGFKSITEDQIQSILDEKDPLNTKKSTKLWISCFSDYLEAKNYPKVEDVSTEDLLKILETFYTEVQKKHKSGDKENTDISSTYKNTTMRTIRAAIARFYREKRGIDIISNEHFIRANAVFTALQKINKKKGLGVVDRKVAMNEYDVQQLMEYFRTQIICDLNPRNLQNIVIFYILYYMCRLGRENLREMKQYTYAISTDLADNNRKFIYQAVDEYDKNHNESDTTIANEGRIYEITGKLLFTPRKFKLFIAEIY